MDSQADHFVTMLENYKVHSQLPLPLSLPCFLHISIALKIVQ